LGRNITAVGAELFKATAFSNHDMLKIVTARKSRMAMADRENE
jgi:hypothetical protein